LRAHFDPSASSGQASSMTDPQSPAIIKTKMEAWVYFMTNHNNNVLYIGVTSNLLRRVEEHKSKKYFGFTSKYNCDKLVYFESFVSIKDAISREKQLKNWKREWKNELINNINPLWKDLSNEL